MTKIIFWTEAATLCNFEPEDDYYAFAESQATPVEPDLIPGQQAQSEHPDFRGVRRLPGIKEAQQLPLAGWP